MRNPTQLFLAESVVYQVDLSLPLWQMHMYNMHELTLETVMKQDHQILTHAELVDIAISVHFCSVYVITFVLNVLSGCA